MTQNHPTTGALSKFAPWTSREDATLRSTYLKGGTQAASKALPARSQSALLHRAQRLGLQRRRRWTPEDDRHLTSLWGTASVAWIARHLNRTAVTTYWRAQKLELPLGCPQGYEYLTAAAKRTGYTVGQLRKVLKTGGVRVWLSMARPTKARRHFHTVDPLDVDEAVASWLASEVVEAAGTSRGMVGETLRAWLLDAAKRGTAMPAPPKGKAHWRVPTATIDAVVAWHDARESLTAAAARVGVKRWKLGAWLAESGVQTERAQPSWLLLKSEVDRVVGERRGKAAA